MSQDLRVIRQMGRARGVDESTSPIDGSVADAFNVATSDGVWRTRPGLSYLDIYTYGYSAYEPDWGHNARILAEYIPDFRYDGSHYKAMVIGGGIEGVVMEVIGISGAQGQSTTLTGHEQSAIDCEYTWTPALWRYTHQNGVGGAAHGEVKYYPVLLFSNGIDPPFIYHQMFGSGTSVKLDAINGASGITYLSTVPCGKCVCKFKERYFMGNLDGGAGNRIAWTGPDSGLAFPCNVWPSTYNLDLGDQTPITAMLPWRDYLLVWKNQAMHALSGDGVGGVWTVNEIASGEAGAIGPHAVCDTGDAVYFYNQHGVFVFNGRSVKKISHPRLAKTWLKLDWSKPGNIATASEDRKHFCAVHDKDSRRVLFQASLGSYCNTTILVYNYDVDSWDVWGMFSDDIFQEISTVNNAFHDIFPFMPQPMFEVKNLCVGEQRIFAPWGDGDLVYLSKEKLYDEPNSAFGISWKIKTHPLVDGDQYFLLRNVIFDVKKTGNWVLSCLPLRENESIEKAMIRNTEKHNFIVSALSAAEHTVDGTSDFQAATDGPVDVWFIPQLTKYLDSVALTTATATNKIKFAATRDFLGYENPMPGSFLVIPEDTAPILTATMYDSDQSLYRATGGGSSDYSTWDNARIFPVQYQRVMMNANVTSRKISLFITNMGDDSEYIDCDFSVYVVQNPVGRLDCKGWEVWIRPIGGRRGGS